jgi:FkbM family methyltransferase
MKSSSAEKPDCIFPGFSGTFIFSGEFMLFNRGFSMYVRNASRLPGYFLYFLRCFFIFRDPVTVVLSSIRRISPRGNEILTRDGMVLQLSGHPDDVATVFLVFARRDYGSIPTGSTVIDIGANIGAFSMYAAHSGAARVFAYEPNAQAFLCLQQNISANHLESVVTPRRLAVDETAGRLVRFPRTASPYNAILNQDSCADYENVETVDLNSILEGLEHVHLVKIDVEGNERRILKSARSDLLARIEAIRLEYHVCDRNSITRFLQKNGFRLDYANGTAESGILWFVSARPFR